MSIDDRIIDMQFNNKQFERGISQSVQSLHNLKDALNLEDSAQSLRELDREGQRFSLSNISRSVEAVSSKFSTMGIVGVTALANITNSAINTGKHIVSALTIDPVRSGFREYETKMNAIQTILTNTQGGQKKISQEAVAEINATADAALKTTVSSNNSALKSLQKTQKQQLKEYNKTADEEIEIVKNKYEEQSELLDEAIDDENKALKKAHDEKLDLYEEEYLAKLKLIDEERYNKIKAIDDLTKAEDKRLKKEKEKEKILALEKAILDASGTEERLEAEKDLDEYRKELKRNELLEERQSKIDSLKIEKDAIKEEYDLKIEQIEDEYQERKDQEKDAYALEKENIAEAQKLRVKSLDDTYEEERKLIRERQEAEREALDEKQEAELTALRGSQKVAMSNIEARKKAQMAIITAGSDVTEGSTLEDVNRVLEELNEYADKTIYNFEEMTRNIGTFTAAGVGLEESARAIKGIANLAAGSGSTSQQASTAMYQLSQALAAGSVKLQDWNSVVNAGMGGQLFQNALKDTAKELGVFVDETKPFRESLQDGWLSADVLTKTLSKFAEDEDLLKAATQVKTFTQLFDTMKESVQSGWAVSWEQIIGDKNQSTEALTAISDAFNSIIEPGTEARNTMLKYWNVNGGRDATINTITNAFKGLMSVLGPVKEAYRDVFPEMTGERLVEISKNLEQLTENFKIGDDTADSIKRTLSGLFSVISIGKEVILSLTSGVGELASNLFDMDLNILSTSASIGDYLTGLNESIKTTDLFGKTVDGVVNGISTFANWLGELYNNLFDIEAMDMSNISNMIISIQEGILDAFVKMDYERIADVINSGVLVGITLGIKKFVDSLADIVDDVDGSLGSITGLLDGVKGSLEAYQSQLKANTLLKIAGAMGILAASIVALSLVDPERLNGSLGAITIMFAELFASMAAFNTISTGSGLGSTTKMTIGMLGIATSVLILSGAISKIASIDPSRLSSSLISLGVILAELAAFMKVSDSGGLGVRSGVGMIALSTGVRILSESVEKFSGIDSQSLLRGIGALGIVLAELAIFTTLTAGGKGMITTSIGLTILGGAMLLFSKSVEDMGNLTVDQILKGLASMAGVLSILAVSLSFMPKTAILAAPALLIISLALVKMGDSLEQLGSLSWEQIGKGLLSLAGVLTILSTALLVMQGGVGGAVALSIVTLSLMGLVGIMSKLGNMSLGEIGKSLLALAGVFVVIGVAGLALTPIIPSLLGLGAALTLIGVGVGAAGAGLMLFATGLSTIAVSGAAGAASLVAIVTSLLSLIPITFKKIGEGIVEFVKVIEDGIPAIASAMLAVGRALIDIMTKLIPELTESALIMVLSLMNTFLEHLPDLVDTGTKLIIALLEGVSSSIVDITNVGIDIMIKFMEALASRIPDLVAVGFEIIIAFIEGLADAIDDNTPRLLEATKKLVLAMAGAIIDSIFFVTDAMGELFEKTSEVVDDKVEDFKEAGSDMIKGLVNGMKDNIKNAVTTAKDVGNDILDAVKDVLGIHSPSREFRDVGKFSMLGMVQGIEKYSNDVTNSTKLVGKKSVNTLKSALSNMGNILDANLDSTPTIKPILDLSEVKKYLNSDMRMNASLDMLKNMNISGNSLNHSNDILSVLRSIFDSQNGSSSVVNKFDMTGLTVREYADINRIASELYRLQVAGERG